MSSNVKSKSVAGGRKQVSSGKLKHREAEYRKVNAELEAKTVCLVKEAEDLMREHCTVEPEPLDTRSTYREHSVLKNEIVLEATSLSADIEKTVRKLEEKLEKEELQNTQIIQKKDVIPLVAEELGSEAMVRFMKAKLRVMQEEVEKLSKNCYEMEKKYLSSQTEVKTLSEQNKKLEKTQQLLQSNMMKYQQLSKDLQLKSESLEGQLLTFRREVDLERSSQKRLANTHSGTEVRLNRALEEMERYKGLYNKLKIDTKDIGKQERHTVESLEGHNKTLEKQKKELINAFQKQMKLIDVLRRQKIHLEAARMLAFTEEEFVKVLDWEST